MSKKRSRGIAYLDCPPFSSSDPILVYFDCNSKRKVRALFSKVKELLEPVMGEGYVVKINQEFLKLPSEDEKFPWEESWSLSVEKAVFIEKEDSSGDKSQLTEILAVLEEYIKVLTILRDALLELGYSIDYGLPDTRTVTHLLEAKLRNTVEFNKPDEPVTYLF